MSFLHKAAAAALPPKLRAALRNLKPQNRLWNQLLPLAPELLCIDVGASYYPHPQWAQLRRSSRTRWLAVEPNKNNLGYAETWSHQAELQVCVAGLSEIGGMQTLYVTNVDSGSSLFPPVVHPSQKHRVTNLDYLFPVTERQILTRTLAGVIPANWVGLPTAVKLDTQGSELSILRGAKSILAQQVVMIETEAPLSAQPTMLGSGRFWEACEFLESQGYELLSLKPYEGNSIFPRRSGGGGRRYLNECDSVFGLMRDVLVTRPVAFRQAMFLCYVVYELYEEALSLLQDDAELADHARSIGTDLEAVRRNLLALP